MALKGFAASGPDLATANSPKHGPGRSPSTSPAGWPPPMGASPPTVDLSPSAHPPLPAGGASACGGGTSMLGGSSSRGGPSPATGVLGFHVAGGDAPAASGNDEEWAALGHRRHQLGSVPGANGKKKKPVKLDLSILS